jgi:Transposase DDE domain
MVYQFRVHCLSAYTDAKTGTKRSENTSTCIDLEPAGVEALHWRLLTTYTVTTAEQARQIVLWHRRRWTVGQVFRTLKSGAVQVDVSQMTQARRFVKTCGDGADCRSANRADRDWPRWADQTAYDRCHRSGACARADGVERSYRSPNGEAEEPASAGKLGLVLLDRRPAGRLVRLYVAWLQAGRAEVM